MLAGAGASMALKPLKAEAVEPTSGKETAEDWQTVRERGIATLHEAALTQEKEQIGIFVRNGNSGQWLDFGETGTDTTVIVPFADVEAALKTPGVAVEVFHTHPLTVIEEARGIIDPPDTKPEPYPMPPSAQDILHTILFTEWLKENSTRLTESVVDPYGVWHWTIDSENPVIKKFAEMVANENRAVEAMPAPLADEARAFLKKEGMEQADPRAQMFVLMQHMDALSPELRASLNAILAPMTEVMRMPAAKNMLMVEIDYRHLNFLDPAERERVIETFKKAGVMLSYTPFESKK